MISLEEALGPLHVIALQDPEHASCSCGVSGTVQEVADHHAARLTSALAAELVAARNGGLLQLRGE